MAGDYNRAIRLSSRGGWIGGRHQQQNVIGRALAELNSDGYRLVAFEDDRDARGFWFTVRRAFLACITLGAWYPSTGRFAIGERIPDALRVDLGE